MWDEYISLKLFWARLVWFFMTSSLLTIENSKWLHDAECLHLLESILKVPMIFLIKKKNKYKETKKKN